MDRVIRVDPRLEPRTFDVPGVDLVFPNNANVTGIMEWHIHLLN